VRALRSCFIKEMGQNGAFVLLEFLCFSNRQLTSMRGWTLSIVEPTTLTAEFNVLKDDDGFEQRPRIGQMIVTKLLGTHVV
jgi:hypothetical protein